MATIIWKFKRRPRYYGTYSLGNSKLAYTTAIFNMTSATDCPSDKPDGFGVCPADCTKCKRCVIGLDKVECRECEEVLSD